MTPISHVWTIIRDYSRDWKTRKQQESSSNRNCKISRSTSDFDFKNETRNKLDQKLFSEWKFEGKRSIRTSDSVDLAIFQLTCDMFEREMFFSEESIQKKLKIFKYFQITKSTQNVKSILIFTNRLIHILKKR